MTIVLFTEFEHSLLQVLGDEAEVSALLDRFPDLVTSINSTSFIRVNAAVIVDFHINSTQH